MTRHRFFARRIHEFEFIRLLWTIPFGGADFREALTVPESIGRRPSSREWHRGWSALAERLAWRANSLADPVSRGNAYLRASNAIRLAEFFLDPADPERVHAWDAAVEWFDSAMTALSVDATRDTVWCDGVPMRTLMLRTQAPTDDLLVVHGGFDSTLEELYFMIGAGAVARGFDVLLWEGPGQGATLRKHGQPFIPEWERPTAAVLDALPREFRSKSLTGIGISLGGHLVARSAAHSTFFDRIVLFDYFPTPFEAVTHRIPRPLRPLARYLPGPADPVVRHVLTLDPERSWMIANGQWTFGGSTLKDTLRHTAAFDQDWAEQITCDVLTLVGDREHFFDPVLAERFHSRLVAARSARLRRFRADVGGELHCRAGAIHLAHEEIFDWIHRSGRPSS